jgi:uncharacterized protein involved in outer membrane biogenesis
MHALLRSKLTWTVVALLLLVGLYAVLGFQVAPRLVRSQATEYVRDTYGRELTLGDIRIHPFKLQAEIRDLSLPDADGKPMVAFRRLFVDYQLLASVWERAFVFREVSLDGPRVRTVIRPDGSLNLADLAPPPGEDEEKDGAPPALWIQSFALTGGAIDLFNQLQQQPIERHFAPVTFTLRDFRTTAEGGRFGLIARSRQDEEFEWKGRFALAPRITSEGEFAIRQLRVPGVAEFAGDALPFLVPAGSIDLGGTYALDVGERLALDVKLPTISATGLALRARGEDEDWITIPSIVVTNAALAVPALAFKVDVVTVEGLDARVWRNADGSINVKRLFDAGETVKAGQATEPAAVEPKPDTAAAEPPTTTPSPTDATGGEPSLEVGSLQLRNARLDFQDRSVRPAARLAVAPLQLTTRGLSLDLAHPLPVELDATINGRARLAVAGEVVPGTAALDADVELEGLAVKDLEPYVAGRTDLSIERGRIDAKGRFSMAPPDSGKPELAFDGNVVVAGFRSKDNALEQDFLNFDRLEVSRIAFSLAPDALRIGRVRVVRPFARVIVSSDQVVNVAAVFDPEGTAKALAERKAEAAAKAQEASRKKTRAEVQAEERAAAAEARARADAPPPPQPELRETGMPIRIREVAVVGGTMDFSDYSVQPNFAAAIQGLEGKVEGLSSDPRSRAKVDLTGNVGEFSPVRIEGTTQPFAFDRYTDIGLRFENISLPVFNPYSGKFAGYNIAKGKLTTDLHYTINSRQLEAQHKIRIDQLEWGEATAARGEATLPVKFATSLLKDADGVITLDVPVSGSLDDPTFRIGPIVWQIIKNVLSKAVTAPFRALGALFKGAEDAQFVEFAAGDATLDPAMAEKLAALGRSLASKTDLRLDIPIGFDARADTEALAQARYAQALAQATSAVVGDRKRGRDEAPSGAAFDTLEPERKLDVLRRLYRDLAGAGPELPEPPEPPEGLSRKERRALEVQASLDWLEAECRKRVQPLPDELEQLGKQRGAAIEAAVLQDTGMSPERVFVTSDGKVTAEGSRVRFELEIK